MKSSLKKPLLFLSVIFSSIVVLSFCNVGDGNSKEGSSIILGVNAYSFADLLSARESRDNDQVYSLFNLLDWCKEQNIQALDPTGYFFFLS